VADAIPPDLQRLFDRQAEALAGREDRTARRMLAAYEAARQQVRERIAQSVAFGDDEVMRYTAQQQRATLAQLEAGVLDLVKVLGVTLEASVIAEGEASIADLVRVLAHNNDLAGAAGPISVDVLAGLVSPSDELRAVIDLSCRRVGLRLVADAHAQIVVGITQRQTWRQIRDNIAGASPSSSVFTRARWQAELVTRNTLNKAYNDVHVAGVKRSAELLDGPKGRPDDPMLMRANEFLDQRTHPLSYVLDGQAVTPGGEFRVNVLDVERRAVALKARASWRRAILWPEVMREGRRVYAGSSYPAHHWERGRVVAWRASWAR
jgi:hypothetical protein